MRPTSVEAAQRAFAFMMASSDAEVGREIERLKAECPEGMPNTLFVMTVAQREPVAEGA